LRVLAIDVGEKIITVLDVFDQHSARNLSLTQRDTPRVRLFDSPFTHISAPLLPNSLDEFFT